MPPPFGRHRERHFLVPLLGSILLRGGSNPLHPATSEIAWQRQLPFRMALFVEVAFLGRRFFFNYRQ